MKDKNFVPFHLTSHIAHFEDEIKVKISLATVSRLLNKFTLNDDKRNSSDTYRLKSAKYPQLKETLYIWYGKKSFKYTYIRRYVIRAS